MKTEQTTLERYLEIQAYQLAEWKTVLKPEIYETLERHVLGTNEGVTNPDLIVRGDQISGMVRTYSMRLITEQIEAEKKQYYYIKAWGKMLSSFPYYINGQIELAIEDKAPVNAIYKASAGTWATIEEVTNPDTIKLLESYVNEFKNLKN